MNVSRLLVALVFLLLLAGCQPTGYTGSKGENLTVENKDDSWLFVNIWAVWCGPCREEIPELNELAAADNNIRVWGIDFDGAPDKKTLNERVEDLGIRFPVLDNDSVVRLGLPVPSVVPTTFLIDPQGNVREQLLGPQTRAGLESVVAKLKRGG